MAQLERQISQNGDDGYMLCTEAMGGFYPDDSHLHIGYYNSTFQNESIWLLFRNVTIPPESTIDAAKLTVVCSEGKVKDYAKSRIEAVAQDNPVPPTDNPDYQSRPRTTAYIYWDDLPHWTTEQVIDSPDLKDMIQEIVNRSGWLAGNNILIYWQDCEGRSTKSNLTFRRLYSREGEATKAPKLTIDYSPPITEPEIETQDATNIKSDQADLHTKVIDDRGKTLSVRHNYGKTTEYGENTPWQEGKHTNDIISQTITDLDPETEHHFRGEATFQD